MQLRHLLRIETSSTMRGQFGVLHGTKVHLDKSSVNKVPSQFKQTTKKNKHKKHKQNSNTTETKGQMKSLPLTKKWKKRGETARHS